MLEMQPIVDITTPGKFVSEIIPAEDYTDYESPDDEYMKKLRDVSV